MEAGKPRVIRKVIRLDAKRRPKVARDRKAGIDLIRVKSRSPRQCRYHECTYGNRMIDEDTVYAKVRFYNGRRMFIGGQSFPMEYDYHFECLPPEVLPLVRFVNLVTR